MFTQELSINADELKRLLLENGYLHDSFSNAELKDIEHTVCKANNKIEIYNYVTFKFETDSLKD